MTETSGRKQLQQYLAADPSRSQNWLARTMGVGQQTVSLWLRGYNRPGYGHMLMLLHVAGILPESWLTQEEMNKILALRERLYGVAIGISPTEST